MTKSEIRKKILKIRKQKKFKNKYINFQEISKILKKNKTVGKIVGAYYPYNYEVDPLKILEKFEKKKLSYFITENRKKFSYDFFSLVNKRSPFIK